MASFNLNDEAEVEIGIFHVGLFRSPLEALNIDKLINIAKNRFEFQFQIYHGITDDEAFYIVPDSDFTTKFLPARSAFEVGTKIALIPMSERFFNYEIIELQIDLNQFAREVNKLCGVTVWPRKRLLACCSYQMKLIARYYGDSVLLSQLNETPLSRPQTSVTTKNLLNLFGNKTNQSPSKDQTSGDKTATNKTNQQSPPLFGRLFGIRPENMIENRDRNNNSIQKPTATNKSNKATIKYEIPKSRDNDQSCCKCHQNSNLLLNVYLDKSYLNKCKKHQIGRCESCLILFDLAQMISQHEERLQNRRVDKFCLKCSFEHILVSKKIFCSNCLRDIPKNEANLGVNRVCSAHAICNKCNGLSLSSYTGYCYFCALMSFYIALTKSNGSSLVENHPKINCCHNFCDLEISRALNEVITLKCAHRACQSICDTGNVCSFCAIKRLIKEYKRVFRLVTEEYVRENIEQVIEELKEEEQEEQEQEQEYADSNEDEELETEDEDDEDEEEEDESEIDENKIEVDFIEAERKSLMEEESNVVEIFQDALVQKFIRDENLPGFENDGTIELKFFVPDGIQNELHPKPGEHYYGICLRAFLPNNNEGRHLSDSIMGLFESGILFKLVECESDKEKFKVSLNGISLKTSIIGGIEKNGYPDAEYLEKLKNELEKRR